MSDMSSKTALSGGFKQAPLEAATAFRAIMTALACPGDIRTVAGATPPAPLSVAAGVALLTLADAETPIFLGASYDTSDVHSWITFHTSAPIGTAQAAVFALGTWSELPLADFAIGTSEYPDRSATLIVELDELSDTGALLRGPGIKETAQLSLPAVVPFQENAQHFPLGLDFIFTSGCTLAGLPRTTKVNVENLGGVS
jgi:alpha-D-ribose 1-methylphosphonate 5-triphosphate synthase subunit PhnH